MNVNIVILNYNGKELLKKYLPAAVEASKNSSHNCCVTVLDNKSSDDSLEFVKANFPAVKIYQAKENKVYCSFNELAADTDEDIIILLNNDMRLDKNFIDPLIRHFKDDSKVFFVASRGDRSVAYFKNGVPQPSINYDGYDELIDRPGHAFSAGVGAFDRKKFLELGGFDELYLPGRFEDVDLCFRGWKRGYSGIYEPQSLQYHEGAASFNKKYTSHQIFRMVFRNEILFTVKNITSAFLFSKFILFLFLRSLFYIVTGRFFMLKGLSQALSRLGAALDARKKEKVHFKLTDKQVISTVNRQYYDFIKTKPKAARLAKRFVEALYAQNNFFKRIFFFLGFFTVRLSHPLEYHILRELMDCDSVLDLGCGRHSMIGILPKSIKKTGVDIFKPYIAEAQQSNRHNCYITADITKIEFKEKSFDAVALLDVLEHLTEEQGAVLIGKIEKWARKKVVIFTPNGHVDQDAYDENPYQVHKTGWHRQALEGLGYKVTGVGGLKVLRLFCVKNIN